MKPEQIAKIIDPNNTFLDECKETVKWRKKINITDLWKKEWKNAYNFFNTKGNTKTKSRLKKKWYKEFKEMLMFVEKEMMEAK